MMYHTMVVNHVITDADLKKCRLLHMFAAQYKIVPTEGNYNNFLQEYALCKNRLVRG